MQNSTNTRTGFLESIKPYIERGPLAAFALGVSSGFPYALMGATLSTRLAQVGIEKKSVTTFALVFLAYNLKFLWAWMVEGVRIPVLARLGQRVSWMLLTGLLVILAVVNLAYADPSADILATAWAAVLLGIAGATFDIMIDAYRIEILEPRQLGIGAGMSQYGWRIGSTGAGALALVLSARYGWTMAYLACAAFALPAMVAALLIGDPIRHQHHETLAKKNDFGKLGESIVGPFVEFFRRKGAFLVLLFIVLHKVGDTLANLTLRLLFNDLGFTNDEIAIYDIGVGFWALLLGVFVGGILYARLGMKKSVLLSLVLMAVSNFSFAALAAIGHSNLGMAASIGFENFSSGIGGVTVIAYFSALCNLRFTAAQYALISAAASIVGRIATGTTAGALIESMGYVNFYILTTIIAFPGVILFWLMMRAGLIDQSIGSAGTESSGA